MSKREVRITINDWSGTWGDLEAAIDEFAERNGVTLETIMLAGGHEDEEDA